MTPKYSIVEAGNSKDGKCYLFRLHEGSIKKEQHVEFLKALRAQLRELPDEVYTLADTLEAEIARGPLDPASVLAYRRQLLEIDARLRPKELAFSRSLADGAHFMRRTLLALSALVFLVLCAYALHVMRSTLRRVRDTESEFRLAFHQSMVGMLKVDRQGRFTQANEALARILGMSLPELRTQRLADVLHVDDLPVDVRGAIDWVRLQEPGERRLLRRDGTVRWVRGEHRAS